MCFLTLNNCRYKSQTVIDPEFHFTDLCNFEHNCISLQSLFADKLQKRVLEYHVKNKSK